MPGLVYVASPYSHHNSAVVESRHREVMHFMTQLAATRYDLVPFSPILHCHEWAKRHDLPSDAEFWRRQNLTMIRHCDELHVCCLDGWTDSKGVAVEIQFAKDIGLPIVYWLWNNVLELFEEYTPSR